MLGEEERSDEEGSFSMASIPKRIAILLQNPRKTMFKITVKNKVNIATPK